MTEQPRVYVTIPVRNDSGQLASNVESLAAQDGVSPADYSVLYLVSNDRNEAVSNSPVYRDNMKALALLRRLQRSENIDLRIMDFTSEELAPSTDTVGLARQKLVNEVINIHGPEKEDSAIVATLDADTLAAGDYIKKLLSIFSDPEVSAAVGSIRYRGMDAIPFKEYLLFQIYDTAYALLHTEPQVSAQSFAVRLNAYHRAGRFKELAGGEDIDLGKRLLELGGVVFDEGLVTYPLLRYSERCEGNGKILFDIHKTLAAHERVTYDVDGATMSVEQLVMKVLQDSVYGEDDLDSLHHNFPRISKYPLSYEESDLVLKLGLLNIAQARFEARLNATSDQR